MMLSVLFILLLHQVVCDVVMTNRGPVKGQKGDDGSFRYLGIPYALVDEKHPFGKSLDHPKFETVFNAAVSSIMCPQVRGIEGGVLQCLRLNIFVPKIASVDRPVPVLVWFHGGGFITGSGGEYDGKYLIQHGIIVVTINYRLGPYGFFCLKDPEVPGNQGLKDQVTALRWVKENIRRFGGNPDEVTIAGQSYGGGAVDLHLYSKNERLFSKAIIQSGSAEVPGMYVKPDYHAAIKLINHLGYNTTSTKDALKHLAAVDPIALMKAADDIKFQPRVCKEKRSVGTQHFIIDDPFHLYNSEIIKDTPILIGYNSKEDFSNFVNKSNKFYSNLDTIFYDKLKSNFNIEEDELKTLAKVIHTFYMGSKKFSKTSMLELADFSSDFILNHAAERSVNRFMNQKALKVYKYIFSYIGGSVFKDVPGVGAYHTEELPYLFDRKTMFNEEQKLIRDRMTKMWANFVKNGNPTPKVTKLLPVHWSPVNESRPYMNIDVNMEMRNYVYRERMALWDLFWHNYWKVAIVTDKRRKL
ncbi:pyrethroid hydrolase Ces2e-like [Achroia grisella]|uniref:pyrethroid hydrolase Ces2e-like n=1 Tax=Achroia grisella TaxID=688607 RepID=UPI0027D244EE|nr:pyrethroid hydrolase Ces2e-like [Achroia grisella]